MINFVTYLILGWYDSKETQVLKHPWVFLCDCGKLCMVKRITQKISSCHCRIQNYLEEPQIRLQPQVWLHVVGLPMLTCHHLSLESGLFVAEFKKNQVCKVSCHQPPNIWATVVILWETYPLLKTLLVVTHIRFQNLHYCRFKSSFQIIWVNHLWPRVVWCRGIDLPPAIS